jgi:hypothetical protein
MQKSLRAEKPSFETKIIFTKIDDLSTNPKNARTHSPRQIREIARSIERFGFNNPVLIDENTFLAEIRPHASYAQATPPTLPSNMPMIFALS